MLESLPIQVEEALYNEYLNRWIDEIEEEDKHIISENEDDTG